MVWCVVFILLVQIIKFSNSLPYELRLNVTLSPLNAMRYDGSTPKLTLEEMFKIRVYSKVEASEILCNNEHGMLFKSYFNAKEMMPKNSYESQTSMSKIKINEKMNGTWHCRLFFIPKVSEEVYTGGVQFSFNVIVEEFHNKTTVTPITPARTSEKADKTTVTPITPPIGTTEKTDKTTVTPITPVRTTEKTDKATVTPTKPVKTTKKTDKTTVTPKTTPPSATEMTDMTLTTTTVTPKSPSARSEKEPGLNVIGLAGIVVVIIAIIVMLICVIVGFYRHKRKSEVVLDVNYENCPRHNKDEIAKPAQWNDQNEIFYSVPYVDANPRVTNSNSKLQYAEARGPDTLALLASADGMEVSCEYANLNKVLPGNQTLYAQVLPKALPKLGLKNDIQPEPDYAAVALKGGKTLNCEYANLNQQPTQAHIQPNSDKEASCTQVLPTRQNAYVKVLPVISPNPNYANLSEQSYANTGQLASEYAEPAYCEVIKQAK